MASPFDILAAVDIVIGLGSRIYDFFSSVKDAPSEVRDMCTQLQLMQRLLPETGQSASDLARAGSFSLDILFRDVLRKISTRVKWMLKNEEIEKFSKGLERAKQTLVLAMLLAGMRVDTAVLEGMSTIKTRVDDNGCMIDCHREEVQTNIMLQLKRMKESFLQKVNVIPGAAAEIHVQSSLRLTDLADSVLPAKSSQTTYAPTFRYPEMPDHFAPSGSGLQDVTARTRPIVEPHTTSAASLADDLRQDIQLDESVTSEFRRAVTQCELIANLVAKSETGDFRPESLLLSWESLYDSVAKIEGRKTPRIFDRLANIRSNMRAFDSIVDILPKELGGSSLMHSGVLTILQAAQYSNRYFESIEEAMNEMQEASTTCTREYGLYPEPELKRHLVSLYTDSFSGMAEILTNLRGGKATMAFRSEPKSDELQRTIAKSRKPSQKVIREVEYLHRKESRQAHLKLREVDKKQDQVLKTLEEQQRILLSLREEQRALSLVGDHRKILQRLRQLLSKFPANAAQIL
ncbi:hypothetical protein S7711_10447 [Stachybotrys chartarum IBT 7711]|uniref:Uncharacterized protein n=1 Tax=Stachybotrys chartarum (strain CBS 109288 / IBT 7711) TaxID=1280523 RepID=A0A084BBQ9_STACB|nr:hypothetical protein S7711_10447 [Stachybotrys chartarum IBT 7711]